MPENIRLTIEYDGEPYCGWQRQLDLPTVQGVLEETIKKIAGRQCNLYGAGRTDSGVHARAQVANFWTDFPIPADRWTLALNTRLPSTIRILRSEVASEFFHSQHSAKGKIYQYRILNRDFASALDRRVYFCPLDLNWDKMRAATQLFIGEKDFRAFQSGKAPMLSTIRRIDRCEISEDPECVFRITVEGNGFLKHMVRNLVGTLLEVGQSVREIETIPGLFDPENFAECPRALAGRTVPARGLCLDRVLY